MSEKITGYLLLVTGIVVMVFSALSVYSVFTGKSQPVHLFAISGISIDFGQIVGGMLPPELAGQAGAQTSKRPAQKREVIPGDVMNQLFNLLSYLMLMGFLMNFGYKLAELGVQMLRPIKVTLKGEKNG